MYKKNTKDSFQFYFPESDPSSQHILEFADEWFNPDSQLVLNTSGSTGAPKQILAQKKHLASSAKSTGLFFNFSSQTLALHCLPLNFIAGKMMLIRILEFQMKGIFTSPSTPLDFPDHLSIDFAAMTPHQYQKGLAENREKLSSISTVLLGGSPISDALEEEIYSMSHTVFHSYGMTETYSHVALREVGKSHFFTALDPVSFSTDDQQCLQINAPHLGISNLLTNDLVDLLDEKRFKFLGRTDFVINSGGIKIHPEILEKKWSKYIKNQNFILAGRKDDLLGERLVMLVEGNNSLNLQPYLQYFEKLEIPKEVVSCEHFEYTSTGKIDRISTQRKYLI